MVIVKRVLVPAVLAAILLSSSCGSQPEETPARIKPPAVSTIEEPVEKIIAENSAYVLDGKNVYDRRPDKDKITYASQRLPGASAIYAKNGASVTFSNPVITGNGYLTDDDLKNELASKYGYASAVLVHGAGAEVTLKKPAIITSPDSNANGGFATCGGKLNIYGGTITTNNRLGHGLDATYGGTIYAEGTTIHTSGQNSGALATDFGGGFITVRNVKATAEVAGSPGIYCAGNSVIKAYDSIFESHGCEAVMAAHDNGYTFLYNCTVTGAVGLNGHNSMSAEYSYITMQGGTLNSTKGALITEMGGKTDMTLEKVKAGNIANGQLIAPESGRLRVTLSCMNVSGDIVRAPKSYLEISLKNTKLNAPITATVVNLDAESVWKVTGESRIVDLTLADSKCITSEKEMTVYYHTLKIGGKSITGDHTVGKVKFVYSADLIDDYEEPGPPGPPPGEGGPPGGPPPGGAPPGAPPSAP